MTDSQKCPQPGCGGRMKFSRVVDHGSFIERRRDCRKCGHADKVYVRIHEEITKIIEVAKRSKKQVRARTSQSPQKKNTRNNQKQENTKC